MQGAAAAIENDVDLEFRGVDAGFGGGFDFQSFKGIESEGGTHGIGFSAPGV